MTERNTSLYAAVTAWFGEQEKAHAEATAPEREARAKQAAADVKLMNTPAWDTIGLHRRRHATALLAQQADTGQTDNVTALSVGLAQAQAQGGGNDAA